MVLKGHNQSGSEIWVTAEYFDRSKIRDRKKLK